MLKLIDYLLKVNKNSIKKLNILNSRVLFKKKKSSSEDIALIFYKLSKKIKYDCFRSLKYIKFYLFLHETYNQLKSKIYKLVYNYKNINESFQYEKSKLRKISRYQKFTNKK